LFSSSLFVLFPFLLYFASFLLSYLLSFCVLFHFLSIALSFASPSFLLSFFSPMVFLFAFSHSYLLFLALIFSLPVRISLISSRPTLKLRLCHARCTVEGRTQAGLTRERAILSSHLLCEAQTP
jgi:hypothetical protein